MLECGENCKRSRTYSQFELLQVDGAQGISLGDDRDEVDTSTQALHDLDIKRLETVTGGTDEVETGVHAQIDTVSAAGLLLLKHVGLVLVVEEFDDGLP